ncbi:excalibur calcium-binding domain-containing protein [Streptomyces sp. NPDC086554]|uniref:excalibur calcium-binding domain-containing protein n=1 Tax=Streptomyces sp. NPDC086554 TaxID=3154864 RepID=UPI00342AA563
MSRLVHGGVLLLMAGAIGVCGCGGSDSARTQGTTTATNTVTVTAEPPTSAPTSPQQAVPSTASDASSVVREYFAAINAQDYRRAWDLGGKNLSDSYEAFVKGFAGTAHDTVHILHMDGDTVSVRLEATQTDGSVRVFEGTYTVHGGTIIGADLREVTGPEPQPSESSPYFENCDEARAAGVTPLHEGDPGYAPHLDRDGDGTACERRVP